MDFLDALPNSTILASLTKGGNLPFRRLCVEYGADITLSEMIFARNLVKGEGRERALVRHHESEKCFGVQLATNRLDETQKAAEIAVEQGAKFIDINCACPIDEVTRKGLGAAMLQRPRRIVEVVEGLARSLSVPVTVKLRIGWDDENINIHSLAQMLEDAGAAALFIHGRTREQRYTKAADWQILKGIVSERSIPIIGNGDILTWFEAKEKKTLSGVAAITLARGALISPWVFAEIKQEKTLALSVEERIGVYYRFTCLMKEHFGDDELGRKRIRGFLPWHFDFFNRYRYFPEEQFAEAAKEYPLMQRRDEDMPIQGNLEALLGCPDEVVHAMIAEELLQCESSEEAVQRLEAIATAAPLASKLEAAV